MKFVVDAQLPLRLAHELTAAGHNSTHTLDFAKGNRTSDKEITSTAISENRVIVTKDEDFVTSYLLRGAPPKLLLISTGNISNDALSRLVAPNMSALVTALSAHNFVELTATEIVIHS